MKQQRNVYVLIKYNALVSSVCYTNQLDEYKCNHEYFDDV